MVSIQWYPGHIAKYERKLKELLKLVDVVVEVLDARMPQATMNPRLQKSLKDKPKLLVLNKSDLADPAQTRLWRGLLETPDTRVLAYETKQGGQKAQLINAIVRLGETNMKKLMAKGLKRRPVRVLIAGMPNVGKSSIINSLVSKKKVQTGHKAGVTRTHQWVRIHPEIELLDSPGIIPPFLESEEAGALLATVSSVGEAAFDDEEVSRFLAGRVEGLYPALLHKHYNIDRERDLSLENIALARNYLQGGQTPDTLRAAQALLTDFRQGRLGRMTLEHAHHNPNNQEERQENKPTEPSAEI